MESFIITEESTPAESETETASISEPSKKSKEYVCSLCDKVLKSRGSLVSHLTSRNTCNKFKYGEEFHYIVQNLIATVDLMSKEAVDSPKYKRLYDSAQEKLNGLLFYITRTNREAELMPEYSRIKANFQNGVKIPVTKQ